MNAIEKNEISNPNFLDFLLLKVVDFVSSFSSLVSENETWLQMNYSLLEICSNKMHISHQRKNYRFTYFSRAASIWTMSSGRNPSAVFGFCWGSESITFWAFLPALDGRGVMFWDHFLLRSFASRTTLPVKDKKSFNQALNEFDGSKEDQEYILQVTSTKLSSIQLNLNQ